MITRILSLALVSLLFAPSLAAISMATFSDAACTQPLDSWHVPVDSSGLCRNGIGSSFVLVCQPEGVHTHFFYLQWNSAINCPGKADNEYETAGSGKTGACLPMQVREGEHRSTPYGIVNCKAKVEGDLGEEVTRQESGEEGEKVVESYEVSVSLRGVFEKLREKLSGGVEGGRA